MVIVAIVGGLLLAVTGLVVLASLGMTLAGRLLARAALSPAGVFGVSVLFGLLLIAVAAVLTGKFVEDVTEGDGIALLDHPVTRFVASHRTGTLTSAMKTISMVGDPVWIAVITLCAGVLIGIIWRNWTPLLLLAVTVAGIGGLTLVFKDLLGRSRPPHAQAVAGASGYGFPSGHAATAAAAFCVLAYLCAASLRSRVIRVGVWAAAAMLAALVGFSRVYLGVHWLSDVIGGWTFGILWAAVVLTGWTWFIRTRQTGGAGRPG